VKCLVAGDHRPAFSQRCAIRVNDGAPHVTERRNFLSPRETERPVDTGSTVQGRLTGQDVLSLLPSTCRARTGFPLSLRRLAPHGTVTAPSSAALPDLPAASLTNVVARLTVGASSFFRRTASTKIALAPSIE
jgi:hypothetical protein